MKKLLIIAFVIGIFASMASNAIAKPVSSALPPNEALRLLVNPVQTVSNDTVGKPAAMSQAEYRALMIRSEGMNQRYGLNTPVKGENYYARGISVASSNNLRPASMSQAEYRALLIRSQGMNQRYGLNTPVKGENYFARGIPDVSTPTTVSATSDNDFQWGDAGIGAAGILGLVALCGAAALGVRRHHRGGGQLRTS
jgi:hypothetical protein